MNNFRKGSNSSKKSAKKEAKRAKKKREGKEEREKCNGLFPIGYCSRCGELRKKENHHIFPWWIFKLLKALKLMSREEKNIDISPLCPRCHHQIEVINQKFTAARMKNSRPALAEIFRRFTAGEEISNDYIIAMAEGADWAVTSQREKTEVEA